MSPNLPAPPPSGQPLSQWAAIAVAAITAISAHYTSVGKGEYEHDVGNVVAFEEEQHEAIIDLRRKVTFLFKRVMELEVGGVKPPGPASTFSPPAPSDAGVEPDADAGSESDAEVEPDFLPPSPPKKNLVPQPRREKALVDQYGMPVWEPLNKKMEQKKQ
jgi:hypothetical protein